MPHNKQTNPNSGETFRNKPLFTAVFFVLLFLTVIALFHTFVFSDKMLYGSDTIQAGVFFRSFYVDYVKAHGTVPVWNPYQFCGIPYIAGFHGDTFYPLSILKFFINIYRALGWNLLLHVFIAGITMFFCARTFGRSQIAAAMATVSYMFASYFVSQVAPGHDGKMYVTALFPLTMLFIQRGFSGRALLSFALLGLTIGVIVLTPHPQMAYYTLWACAFFFTFKLINFYLEQRSFVRAGKFVAYFVLAVVIGLSISAIHFYPGYQYVKKYSPRSDAKRGQEWAKSWSLHAEETVGLVVPEFSGVSGEKANTYWGKNPFKDNSEYAGVIPLFLAILAVSLIRSRMTWFFGGLAVFALIYGLAGGTPFFYVFYYLIPNVKSTRAWSMIMFLFCFSISLLSAFAIDFLIEQGHSLKAKKKRLLSWILFGIPGIVSLAALLFTMSPEGMIGIYKNIFYRDILTQKNIILNNYLGTIVAGFWITSVFLWAAALVVWAFLKRKAKAAILWLVVLIALIDVFRFDLQFIRTVDQRSIFQQTPLTDYFHSIKGKFRVLNLSMRYLPTNYFPMFGIEEMTSYHGNQPRWYENLLGGTSMSNMLNRNLMDITNTRYLVVSPASPVRPDQLQAAGFTETFNWQNLEVFQNPSALPRAFLVHHWEVDPDSAVLLRRVLSRGFTPSDEVILEKDPGFAEPADTDDSSAARDSVAIVEYDNPYIKITTTSRENGILVLGDNWYPAWKGFVDGEEVPVYRVDGAFRGITLSPGEHVVEFKYISKPYKIGKLLTILSLCLVGVIIVGNLLVRPQRSPETDHG